MKIYAPNGDFTGEVAGVAFANGEGNLVKDDVGEDRYEHLKQWFGRKGYGVGSKSDAEQDVHEVEQHKALEDHSVPELKDIAKQHGIVGGSDMNKSDLITALREAGVKAGSEGPRS